MTDAKEECIIQTIMAGMLWDRKKALLWMHAANPLLGGTTPMHMIAEGRFDKLQRFVVTSLEENRPAEYRLDK